jgi:O-antigen ligase
MSISRQTVGETIDASISGSGSVVARMGWLVLLSVTVLGLLHRSSRQVLRSTPARWLVAYLLVVAASAMLSRYPGYTATRAVSLVIYVVAAASAVMLVSDLDDFTFQQTFMRRVTLLLVVSAMLLGVVFPEFGLRNERLVGPFSYPNLAGRTAAMVIIWYVFAPTCWIAPYERLLRWGVVGLMVIAIVWAESRSVLGGLVLAVAGRMAIAKRYRWLGWTAVVLGGMTVAMLGPLLIELFFGSLFARGSMSAQEELLTLTGRTFLWRAIFETQPITALGIGYKTLFYGDYGAALAGYNLTIFGGAHNGYIEPLVETGVLGLITLLGILWSSVSENYQLRSSWGGQYGNMLFVGVVFIATQSIVIGVFDRGSMILWVILYYGLMTAKLKNLARMNDRVDEKSA